ncbi:MULTISPECIES: hypothetical protein [unclassified Streptomyces]|uniref:hypothetical protein n=1 Tax=unclassified Streptomyces TaxID=2593676 RepID=UPI002966DE08|nr:hypothetical protein [Streptomyces sp. SJL17-1]
MQPALSGVGLLAAVLAAVPLLPPFADEWLLLGIGLALLVPLHLATLFRSVAVELRNRGFARNKANQWRALRALPRRVHARLVDAGLAGAFLVTGAACTTRVGRVRLSGPEEGAGRVQFSGLESS